MKTIHAIIFGKVQGVFFRDNTQRTAYEHGITGWVRNNADGTVELEASGNEQALQKFQAWLKVGPTKAHVTDIKLNELELKIFDDFKIR